MKKNNKKTNIIIFIIMLVVLILIDLFIYSKFIYNERSDYVDDFSEYDYSLDEENLKEKIDIQDGKIEIIQTVTGTGNNLEGITIGFNKDFRTYNKSQIEIKIVEHETKNVINSYNNIYDETALNYLEHKFTFKKQKESLDKKYDIIIDYDNSLDDNQVLYSEKNIDSGTLTINGKDYLGHISYKLHYDSKYANIIFLVSIIIINLLSIICFYIILFKNINLDKIFLAWISILGIIYLGVIPMYRGHDEQAHFFKAYEISQGIFNTKIENEKSIVEVPVAFTKAMLEINEETNLPNIDKGYYSSLRDSLNLKITPETIKLDGSYMAVYSCIPYIPQALTIKLASLFTDRVVLIFYLARFANLIVSIIILYISFKIIPFGKKLLFLICMIPTVMFQISTMSPDALTFTSSILFISYVLKLINDKTKITKKNVAILTIIGLIVGLCKITYIPIVLIALAIPKTQYKDKKSKIISLTLIILIPIIINLLWLNIAGKHLALIDNNKAEAQKEFILSNPINYIRTSSYTLFTEIQTYLRQCFGAYMGQIDYVHTSDIITNIYIIMFILIVLFDDTLKDKISNFGKILIGIILLGITALIFTSLYMQWAGYKWYFINGLQGRYFIQLLLPLGLILGQNNISKNSKIDLKKVILSGTILTNIIAIMSCVVLYI